MAKTDYKYLIGNEISFVNLTLDFFVTDENSPQLRVDKNKSGYRLMFVRKGEEPKVLSEYYKSASKFYDMLRAFHSGITVRKFLSGGVYQYDLVWRF